MDYGGPRLCRAVHPVVFISVAARTFAAAWTRSGTNADGLAVRRPSLTLFDGLPMLLIRQTFPDQIVRGSP